MAAPGKALLLALILAPGAFAQPLAARLQALLQGPRFEASRVGVSVVSLDTGLPVFEQDAGKFFVPASNAKLFTCAMALCRLGPERRIRTSVLAGARPGPGGVLKGDLVLYGRGDPMLLARDHGYPGTPDPFEALAAQVALAGVREVRGDVVGDDSFFRTRPFGSGWESGDRDYAFGADVSALTVHDNMVDLRVYPGRDGGPCFLFPMPGLGLLPLRNLTTTGPGPAPRALWEGEELVVSGALARDAAPATLAVPVRRPALFAAGLLRRALERHGVRVMGGTAARTSTAPVELAFVESPAVRDLVRTTLKDSVNLYAQLLLLQAGGSEEAGLAALAAFLKEAGIAPGDVLLEEGAGLSRKDLVKPRALTALLKHMATRPEGAAFADALPLAAVDGTLRNRMGDSPAAANTRAKTGTLRNTHALAGYVTTAGGERLAFAILLNNHVSPAPTADIDALANLLAGQP
ncbi:D-alanyl-D-alanine carboxypeptidase/D-alanyl-D-alanine endopeptidase [Mesoterricola silvestris]|uniref:Peptidase M15 n=1 Tax=Mesoterricola silvestris TaxID=2927979 RepID=A0AA48GLZ2_9BACT|nr:D-alanyl-D-alanine carboxypeptidase/D-alanyl-D-alanine-endopeptidase [Mesoterricola silvestris]BDU73857.1 peptidase M15 [Mesoterricola silvestris]